QASPHDVHDWDAVETPVIFNAPFDGQPRELLAQASRNGFFFVLDRTDGKHLVTAPFINETWASGIDASGHPIPKPQDAPRPDGALVEPASGGSTNWMSPSFDPQTGLFYVRAYRDFSVYYLTASGKAEGWAGTDKGLWGDCTIRALDYRTGKVVWDHEMGRGGGAGVLTTAGHLLFTGDGSGNLLALDPATGKTLWHAGLGGAIESSPETFELDGRQYIVISAQDLLFAFTLPQPLAR
ncbi:MAG: PQQ-binding-like beta-propeller repeat protein, partial [Terriglobia bacterium]